jgi:hypothetical protein
MQPTLRGDAIGLARRRLLDEGSVPGELVGDALAASWQRSMAAGLDPSSAIAEFPRASTVQLAEARERQRELIDHAMPTLAYLHSQTRDTGSVIVLSNAQGLLLQSCGDPEFIDRAARVNLAPGASWTEEHRGTNAVGTSLASTSSPATDSLPARRHRSPIRWAGCLESWISPVTIAAATLIPSAWSAPPRR